MGFSTLAPDRQGKFAKRAFFAGVQLRTLVFAPRQIHAALPAIEAREVSLVAPKWSLRFLRSLLPKYLNLLAVSKRYGEPDSWFESRSLRHELSI
jgi:hypothetical protein